MNVKFIIHVSFLLNIQNSLNVLIYMYDEYSKATKKHPSTPPHKELSNRLSFEPLCSYSYFFSFSINIIKRDFKNSNTGGADN